MDGQIAGAHPASQTVLADVVEQGEQPLEEEETGCRQLVATLREQEHNVNKVEVAYTGHPGLPSLGHLEASSCVA